jgi:GntR family transcriptional regulator
MATQKDNLADAPLSQVSPVPKYHQLREILRDQLQSWEPHEMIPSEAQLCSQYAVSRTTVRKALDYLIYEGLLYRVQGKGTFVAAPKVPGRYVQQSAGIFDDMAGRGIPIRTRVLEQGIVRASAHVSHHLNLNVGDKVFRLLRLRYIADEVALLSESLVPYHLVEGIVLEDFTSQSLYRVMREKYGLVIHHGMRLIEAQPASDEEAELLQVPVASPLLVVIGTMYDATNQPLEHGYAKHRGDRGQVEIHVVPHEQ